MSPKKKTMVDDRQLAYRRFNRDAPTRRGAWILRYLTFGIAKVLFMLAIAAVSVKAVKTLNSANAQPPHTTCPCQCPYYSMCSGPPACVCMEL